VRKRRWIPAAIAAGVVVLVTVGWTIHVVRQNAPDLAASNSRVLISGLALEVPAGQQLCQNHDWVPGDARSVRLFAGGVPTSGGPPLQIQFQGVGGTPTYSVDVPAGYPSGPLEVPIDPSATIDPAVMCIRNLGTDGSVFFAGNLTEAPTLDVAAHLRGTPFTMTQRDVTGALRGDDVRADFFTDKSQSFFSEAATIAERFALYKPSFAGDNLMYVVLGGFIVIAGVGIWLAIRAVSGIVSIRTAAIAVAIVAVGHAWVWALTTPPDQVPDEGVHVAYTDYLAATRHLPSLHPGPDDPNETLPGYNLIWDAVAFSASQPANWSAARDSTLRQALDHLRYATNEGAPGSAAPYPPLYYAFVAVPARIAQPINALDRFFILRLWSGLLFGATALSVLWFLREAIPHRPWTWVVGALAVALQPVAAFMAGGINNDNLLYAEAAALIALTARCLRRGIDRWTAFGIAAVSVAGILTKPTIAVIFPGLAVALFLAVRRHGRQQLRPLVEAGAASVGALGAWVLIANVWSGRSPSQALGLSGGTELSAKAGRVPLSRQLDYVWQYFLPKLPQQTRPVGYLHYPVYDVYWHGLVGMFGYFAYGFSFQATRLALIIGFAVVGLAIAALVLHRVAVRRRWGDLVVYGVMVVTTLLFVSYVGYRQLVATGVPFEQTRYLFPLLALYGGVIALAAAPRRWSSIVGPGVVAIAGAQAWFSLLLTISHYYT
jgi:hypothetical protein